MKKNLKEIREGEKKHAKKPGVREIRDKRVNGEATPPKRTCRQSPSRISVSWWLSSISESFTLTPSTEALSNSLLFSVSSNVSAASVTSTYRGPSGQPGDGTPRIQSDEDTPRQSEATVQRCKGLFVGLYRAVGRSRASVQNARWLE